jgi:hypothetical protein
MTADIELRIAQELEAEKRIKMLGLHPNAVKEFIEEKKLNLSDRGILFWLTDVEQQMIREWEDTTGNIAYHIIRNNLEFGLCYSILYISQYQEEWENDIADLQDGYPIAYVLNADDEFCSEYGSIGIKPFFGGLLRTA